MVFSIVMMICVRYPYSLYFVAGIAKWEYSFLQRLL